MTINIPKEFNKKAINTKCQRLIFDNPIIPMPTSSGNGLAMINAPMIGISQIKNGVKNNFLVNDPPILVKMGASSSNILSFKKRKIR